MLHFFSSSGRGSLYSVNSGCAWDSGNCILGVALRLLRAIAAIKKKKINAQYASDRGGGKKEGFFKLLLSGTAELRCGELVDQQENVY